MKVKNSYDTLVEFEAAVMNMDSEIKNRLLREMPNASEQEFFNAYAKEHELKWEEEWEMDVIHSCG